MKWKKPAIILSSLLLISFIWFLVIYISEDIDSFLVDIEDRYSEVLLDENREYLHVSLNKDEQWQLKNVEGIPEKLKIAVLTYEDKNFYHHGGVDYLALLRTVRNNIMRGKRNGASTITMQVAKLTSNGERTYYNKIREIIRSIKLERKLTKDQILALYLDNAPYGGNVVGFATAAHMYFRQRPSMLTWSESATLAVLPNAPGLINLEKNRKNLEKKKNELLDRLYAKGYLTETELELAKMEPIPRDRHPFERIAPHLARRLATETRANGKEKQQNKTIVSTINLEIQQKMNKVAREYAKYIRADRIENLALLVIDNRTYKVKAYVGSQNFLDEDVSGQVDGIQAKRSPGSLLKPFLYACAIDDGQICPESTLPDVPLYFYNFKPQNASKQYSGMIKAHEALSMSLNIPFVHLLQRYKYDKFYDFLREALEFTEDDRDRYGLSIILGTKEMTMEQLGILYAGLANYGKFQSLKYVSTDNSEDCKQLISPGAAYLTLDAMHELKRPGLLSRFRNDYPVAWKTGTSYGRRDAWACGVTPEYTIIAWVGNFSGKGNEKLIGSTSGGKLLFNAFQELLARPTKFAIPKDELIAIDIDEVTGYLTDYPDIPTKKAPYPKNAKPLRKNLYYKKIYVDESGNEIDSRDSGFVERQAKIVLNYPVEVVNYLKKNGIDTSEIYYNKSKATRMRIVYPENGLKIFLPRDFDGEQTMIAKIINVHDENIYWYVDGELVAVSKDTEQEILLGQGEHSIAAVSESGATSRVHIYIEKPAVQNTNIIE